MSKPIIGIRTHGGPGIGLGHVRRCLTLAEALAWLGAQVGFVVNDDDALLRLIRGRGYAAVGVVEGEDRASTAAILRDWQALALIADSYDLPYEHLAAWRKAIGFLVVIDDLADRELPADVVTNSTISAAHFSYRALPTTVFLLGPSYALLRQEFAAAPQRQMPNQVERVLITVGGSDLFDLTPQLMKWVWDSLGDVALDVVVGPFFDNVQAIERTAVQCLNRASIHYDPQDIRTLMVKADIAITGGGQTTYELAASGMPAVAICLADNQAANLAGLAQVGTLDYGGSAGDDDLEIKVTTALKTLAGDIRRRQEMGACGRRLVDGHGAQRVAQVIIELAR
jgi:UDP-2,4-diacetamido-2,4,6-trideoxy-beta-L-altropyranose hydrolase